LLPLHVVSRGDRLRIPAAWRLDKPATGYLEYTGHIRFENEALPATGSFMSLISKPLRRIILERRAGGSYRWRAVEMPFLGLCPPAAWPVGEWLPDTLDIRVPDQLLPGRYTLRLGLERGTLYPVHTMADLFQDVDRYSGPVAGTLEVR
jgi:hypothetical protein